jgi:hypothetical protein
MLLLLVIANLAALPALALAQPLADSGDSSGTTANTTPAQPDLPYTRPTQTTKLHNYLFDAFGPYPIVGVAIAAGISQASNGTPDWKQRAEGYGKRFASDFGIAAVTTTTRYALAEAFRQDALYYRCECKGVFPRLRHAVISTLTPRSAVCGHDDGRLWLVPQPLRRQGCAPYGQLQSSGICGREHRPGVPL